MWRLLSLAFLQSAFLAGAQVSLKLTLQHLDGVAFSWRMIRMLLCDWVFALSGACFGLASVLWLYMLKHFPLSMAYPMVSLSYIMGMLAALLVFHEQIPLVRWMGLALIVVGVILVSLEK